MADVYKVAVALSMTSNAPAFLSALSSKLLHVHAQVKDLEGGLTRLNRIKLAVGGGLAIAGGTAALAAVGKMVDKGNELVKIQQNMAQAGVKAVEVQEAYAKAWQLTGKYTNVSAAEALKVINEARMTFGSQEDATHHSEDFIKMISFLKAFQGGKHAGGAMEFEREAISAMKSGEIAGKVTPAEMAEHVKQLTAMRVAYGDQLKISQYLTAQRAGGVALRNTSDEFRYGAFPALVQENGPGAGVMLMTAFNKIVAGTGNKLYALDAMSKVGILDEKKVAHHPISGKVTKVESGAILGDKLFAQNPLEWTDKVLRPKLDAITKDPIEQAQWISKMFPDRNAAKAITEMLQQYTKLSKDAAMMLHARQSINEGSYLDKSWEGQKQAFHEQWENFVQALGAPLVGIATENLKKINTALSGMAQWAARPEMAGTVEAIGKGLAVLGAALTAGGAAALLAALGPAGWLAIGITGAAAAFVAFHEPFEKWIKSTTGMGPALDAADAAFNKAALAFGEWVKAITPSAETMGTLAAKLITEIASWPGRLSTAITEMGTSLVTAIGDMLKSLFSKLNPFSKTAFEGGEGFGGLVQKASFGGGGFGANDNYGGASGVARSLGRGGLGGAGGGVDRGGINAVGGSTQSRAHYLMDRLIAKGWTREAAAAAAGNAVQESGVRPSGVVGDSGTAHGIFQWRFDRWQAAQAYMRAHPNLSPMDAQIDFFDLERKRRGGIQAQMHSHRTVEEANRAMKAFERYGDSSYGTRGANARGLLKSYQGSAGKPTQAPTAGPPPKREQWVQVNSTIQMDGRKVGHMISRHQAEAHLFPKKAGGMDTHGGWRAPGTPVTDAA